MKNTVCSTHLQLAGFLRESYQDHCGNRPSPSSGPSRIRIDDREPRDVSPDFCYLSILFQAGSESDFTLHLTNPPLDDETRALIDDKDGKITGSRPDLNVEIPLLTKEVGYLRKLAQALRRIVGRGRTYSNRNWKWVCRRTADSIDRLADRLMEYRKLRRHTPWRLFASSSSADAPSPAGSGSARDCSRVRTTTNSNQADEEDIFRRLGME